MKYLCLLLLFTSLVFPDNSRRIQEGSKVDKSEFHIKIDGQNINLEPDGLVISINHDKNKNSEAEVTFQSNISAGSKFKTEMIGSKIEIRAGYHQSFQTIFTGKVRSVSVSGQGNHDLSGILKCRGSGSGEKKVLKTRKPLLDLELGNNVKSFDLTHTLKGLIKGSVLIRGRSEIRTGHRMILQGFPSGFNGKVIVIGLTHSLRSDSWTTLLTVKQFK